MDMHIYESNDYGKFHRSDKRNRALSFKEHRKLYASMQKYGFLWEFHAVVERCGKHFTIIDGQHRVAIAERLGLPVYYVITDRAIDVPEINSTSKAWTALTHIQHFANNGNAEYQKIKTVAAQYEIPITLAAMMLSGNGMNCRNVIPQGTFVANEHDIADVVGSVIKGVSNAIPRSTARHRSFVQCVINCARIPGFDAQRLISGILRCPEAIKPYGQSSAMLSCIEECYNYGRRLHARYPLAMEAKRIADGRNAFLAKVTAKANRSK